MPDVRDVAIRPIEADDADALGRLFHRLSPDTLYKRFFQPVHEPPPAALRYLAAVDHDRRDALVAEVGGEIIGVARYDRAADGAEAEVAVLVEDAWQGCGLGRRLVRRLARLAAARGIETFTAVMLGDNRVALRLLRAVDPDASVRLEAGELVVRAPLAAARAERPSSAV